MADDTRHPAREDVMPDPPPEETTTSGSSLSAGGIENPPATPAFETEMKCYSSREVHQDAIKNTAYVIRMFLLPIIGKTSGFWFHNIFPAKKHRMHLFYNLVETSTLPPQTESLGPSLFPVHFEWDSCRFAQTFIVVS